MGSHAAAVTPVATSGADGVVGNAVGGAAGAPAGGGTNQERGPTSAWECGIEVSNLSWAPVGNGSGILGIVAGRGLWGVQM